MKKLLLPVMVAVAAVLFAACSSSGSGSMHSSMDSSDSMRGSSSRMKNQPVATGARQVAVRASSFRFSPKKIELSAGEKVAIKLTATDVEHDFTVEGVGHVVHANGGRTAKGGLTIDQPGSYTFYCSVSGHRQAGMSGTISVR